MVSFLVSCHFSKILVGEVCDRLQGPRYRVNTSIIEQEDIVQNHLCKYGASRYHLQVPLKTGPHCHMKKSVHASVFQEIKYKCSPHM